jgi:hypothetical protein
MLGFGEKPSDIQRKTIEARLRDKIATAQVARPMEGNVSEFPVPAEDWAGASKTSPVLTATASKPSASPASSSSQTTPPSAKRCKYATVPHQSRMIPATSSSPLAPLLLRENASLRQRYDLLVRDLAALREKYHCLDSTLDTILGERNAARNELSAYRKVRLHALMEEPLLESEKRNLEAATGEDLLDIVLLRTWERDQARKAWERECTELRRRLEEVDGDRKELGRRNEELAARLRVIQRASVF